MTARASPDCLKLVTVFGLFVVGGCNRKPSILSLLYWCLGAWGAYYCDWSLLIASRGEPGQFIEGHVAFVDVGVVVSNEMCINGRLFIAGGCWSLLFIAGVHAFVVSRRSIYFTYYSVS